MRRPRVCRERAFTLVEILIVVVILGILGTIIIGLFQNGTKDAAAASLKDNLRSLRSQLQLYAAHHGGYPEQADLVAQLTQFTDGLGDTSASKTDTHIYGPYILTMPSLPVGVNRGKSSVTTLTYSAGFGWGYDAASGTIKANCPDSEVDSDGIPFNTY
jgi:general secretion pathway protein G